MRPPGRVGKEEAMSAYLVTLEHIQYLIEAGKHYGMLIPDEKADFGHIQLKNASQEKLEAFGQMLWDENVKSVEGRYPDCKGKELPGEWLGVPMDDRRFFRVGSFWTHFDPLQVIAACKCYAYQSCEHKEWEESQAHKYTEGLIGAACSHLPGYDKTIWGSPKPYGQLQRMTA